MGKVFVVIVDFNSGERVKKIKNEISLNSNIQNIFIIDNSPPNKNLGFAAAVNIGIKRALENGAEKVLLLNPDLNITNESVNNLIKNNADIVGTVLKFERGKKMVLDYGGQVDRTLGRTSHLESSSRDSGHTRAASQIDYVSGACMLIKKEVFEKIGFFDERFFMYFEDVDFCLRAKKSGFSILIDTSVIVEHQISEHKFSRDRSKLKFFIRSNFLFIQKWVPWFARPLAWVYLLFLLTRIKD